MRGWACGLAVALLLPGCLSHPAAHTSSGELQQTLDALAAMRSAGGAWPAGLEPYVVEAAARAHVDVAAWPADDPLAGHLDYPPGNASFLSSLRPLYALALAGLPREDASRRAHMTTRLMQGFDGHQFGDPALLNDDMFAILALAAAGADLHDAAYAHVGDALRSNQTAGGWSWAVGGEPETDTTGAALEALSALPGSLDGLDRDGALEFLASTRMPDRGHALSADGKQGNCDSTVWAIRAGAVIGAPEEPKAWEFLDSLRQPDGSYAYLVGGSTNALCTAEAATLLALAGDGSVHRPA